VAGHRSAQCFSVFFRVVTLWLPMAVSSAWAGPAAFGWSADVGGDLRWFDWREKQGGQQLLAESGPVGALLGDVALDYGPAYVSAGLLWGGGLVRYDGHLQDVQRTPYAADAEEQIAESRLRLGWRTEGWDAHLGLLQRDWHRYIEGSATVSSAEERYRWRLLTAGGELQMHAFSGWQLGLALEGGVPVNSFQKVYARYYDAFALEPGDGRYWRIALPLRQRGQAAGLLIEPYYQEQDMARSNAVPLYRNGAAQGLYAYQPESVRRELGVSLRWIFGQGF
jgi:hypothetical protein